MTDAETEVDALAVRYGHKLRLCAHSVYIKDATITSSVPNVGIGYYEKNGRHGILNCVSPLGGKLDGLFYEDEYLVLDPANVKAPGDIVEYGQPVVLVNQHGMVWNNKTGGITGYVGPRQRGIPGEMFVSFRRWSPPLSKKEKRESATTTAPLSGPPGSERDVSTASINSSSSLISSGSSSSVMFDGVTDGPVRFGDQHVVVTVVESNRHSQMFNKRLTNFKKPTSKIVGGYICCDGKGTELRFTIRPAAPRIEQITMLNKLITAYNYGQKIALPMGLLEKRHDPKTGLQDAEILFKLTNQTTATISSKLLQDKILQHASANGQKENEELQTSTHETEFALPLRFGPGELVVKLVGIVPRRVLKKLVRASERANRTEPVGKRARVVATARAISRRSRTPLQKVGAVVRQVPVPVFALVYAFLIHFLRNNRFLPRQLVVIILLIVPLAYVAMKVDHPFSLLFHAPPGDSEEEEEYTNTSLKLIVTQFRFDVAAVPLPTGPLSANGQRKPSMGDLPPADVLNGSETSISSGIIEPSDAVIVPRRFILAEKGDEVKGRERYLTTLAWRTENHLDTILSQPWEPFRTIKNNYPHYYHKRGNNGEPVYYEKPGKINLKGLKAAQVTLKDLMHNYLMVTEFLWQVLEPDDNKKCISVLDVEGIGISDFVGEAVEYVRNAASVSGSHYPERCAYIFIINVPSWFSMIWNTVKTMVDEVTREKVIIVRGNKKKILEALAEKIPLANIPEEYGGESVGKSPEEELLFDLMAYVNGEPDAPAKNPIEAYVKTP
ncbi:hypothetical protein Poli38472_007969 [Pythium oligandrum]|uniref:CRAL-TRIO domain-containing protein n=1 Tax=Pythium oligandrum TaxID=41045 RepID=A0A8K1FMY8_PYTOL|nr:hypothetical protein Poli38472_007969 [Pythium oligandrum]|eukprot:TMW65327.1 hypothetical protein Poli38472_007969 [Pythium oligandrum]